MKKYFWLFLFFFLASACQKNTPPSKGETLRSDYPGSDDDRELGIVPNSIGFRQMQLNTVDYNWRDLDIYYKEEVLKKYHDTDFYDNLRNELFFSIVVIHKLTENAGTRVISTYARDMQDMPCIPEPTAYIMCLKALEGMMLKAEIKKLVEERYDKNMAYFQANFNGISKLPEYVIKNQEKLKDYAASLTLD